MEVCNMVYVMLTAWIPADKAKIFGKRVIEAFAKFPADKSISKTVLQMAGTDEGYIRTFSINEVVDGKITEAMSRATRFAIFYAEGVGEGFKYKIETLMSAIEAMRVIEMEMPE